MHVKICWTHIFFWTGFINIFRQRTGIDILGNPSLTCVVFLVPYFGSSMSSTWLILVMTFERFYSIIRPHKAASFNTVKKAKITIVSIFVFFTLFNTPHSFLSEMDSLICVAWGKRSHALGQFYFYISMIMAFILPFALLLAMNCVIIHTLKRRSNLNISQSRPKLQGQDYDQGQPQKSRNPDNQITVTLLVVTFSFLALTTPAYSHLLYLVVVGMGSTPKGFATFYLFYHLGEKSFYTNYAINFFLYVISGKKFRTDLVNLFRCRKENRNDCS